MMGLVWAQLLRRGSRSLALLLGLLVACAGFTVLTGQVRSSSLRTVGTIRVNDRSAYDILVRPRGAQSPLERKDGLVQAGFLTQGHGGISMTQWRTIEKIHGVQVAAPVAVIGYVMPKVQVPVLTAGVVPPVKGRSLTRVSTTWRTDNGASVVTGRPSYLYVTPNPLSFPDNGGQVVETEHGHEQVIQRAAQTAPLTVQSPPTQAETLTTGQFNDPAQRRFVGQLANPVIGFPFLVEAVDPESEAKLAGLKSAVTTGAYLQSSPVQKTNIQQGVAQVVPVLVASSPATHVSFTYQVEQLGAQAANAVGTGKGFSSADTAPGRPLATGTVTQTSAYQMLLAAMKSPSPFNYFARQLSYLYTTGGTSYQVTGQGSERRLTARTVKNQPGVWANSTGDQLGSVIPAGGDDAAFRPMSGYQWDNSNKQQLQPPEFHAVGTFDASKLPGYSALSQVPLGTYASTVLTGATAKDRAVLGGKALPPAPNIAGYVQPAPLMLTTLSALPVFEKDSGAYATIPGDTSTTPGSPVNAAAPITSIRIRVAGVHGIDATSRARVRLVAGQIQSATGLTVDVTVGSSPAPQTVVLAAGRHGRPQLTVHENWVKKGVALALVSAINKKSLALFLLVLVVCALFVTNIAAASVRARRTELGVLACVGWSRTRLFRLVATEIGLIAGAAGVGGALVAWVLGAALGIPIAPARAALAIPVALAVALVAGLVPAWRAAHAPPLEAVRPTASLPRPAIPHRRDRAAARERAANLLESVGLAGREHTLATRLSGGQQQRVAIARALMNAPDLLLADEPTGNLDSATGTDIIDLLLGLREQNHTTILLATHDTDLAARTDHIIHLKDGQIVAS